MTRFISYGVLILMGLISFVACQKENTFEGSAPMISTSTDTLTFDTVFTTVGSATRSFKIYNRESSDIKVNVSLVNGASSKFRLNVDGIAGDEVNDVFIGANDSIYIFADVTVDPDEPLSISPFIIEENILVTSNDSETSVLLVAWGQNANYRPLSKRTGSFSLLSCNFGEVVWDDPKPYVIYGVILIDSCDLVLPAGTDVYVHGGLVRTEDFIYDEGLLLVGKDGKLIANGTVEEPVTFQGDRLEDSFEDVAGQWAGIRYLAGSSGNEFNHVILKNSIIGVRADSASQVSLNACDIHNVASTGIIGVHADIDAVNCLVYNTGSSSATLTYGGNYNFDHCTFASYGNQSSAVRFDNFRCTDPPLCQEIVYVNQLNANFRNCIFTGNENDEVIPIDWTDGEEPGLFQYQFTNCAVTIDEILEPEQYPNFFDNCENCFRVANTDTLFMSIDENDYRLDTMSVGIDKGFSIPGIDTDIIGNNRDNNPDVGCYEFIF